MAKPFESIGGVVSFDIEFHLKLRKLRLFHWLRALESRKCANDIRQGSVAKENESHIKYYDKRANYHLGQVQLLNEFFMIGDTAEKDESEGLTCT